MRHRFALLKSLFDADQAGGFEAAGVGAEVAVGEAGLGAEVDEVDGGGGVGHQGGQDS